MFIDSKLLQLLTFNSAHEGARGRRILPQSGSLQPPQSPKATCRLHALDGNCGHQVKADFSGWVWLVSMFLGEIQWERDGKTWIARLENTSLLNQTDEHNKFTIFRCKCSDTSHYVARSSILYPLPQSLLISILSCLKMISGRDYWKFISLPIRHVQ